MTLLAVENLSIEFGPACAVRDLSLRVEEGQALGLVGESGSGKSVTSLAILRLLDPAARVRGAIHFAGRNLLQLSHQEMRRLRGREISMIFQEPMTALNPVMPVGKQIAEAIAVHHPEYSRRQVRATALEAMHAVALPDPLHRYQDYPHQFSGGQRQRILIAMAIANHPRLLIADEPTTALDVTVQAQILELLASLRERFRLAMLFISHDLAVVAQIADRVAVLRNGLLLEEGPRDVMFRHPAHPYTQGLLAAAPTMRLRRNAPLATIAAASATPPPAGSLIEREPGHWVRG